MQTLLLEASQLPAAAVSGLISAIWEGTILAAGVWLCLRMIPRLSAAARSLVWLNAFLVLVLLHAVPLLRGHEAEFGAVAGPRFAIDGRWSLAIAGVWAALSLWRGAQLVVSAVRLRQLARRATPVEVDELARALLTAGPAGRAAELCTSDEVVRPSVLGFFRPRILLPPGLVEKLTAAELRQVVLHEMEHLRRGDDWTNLLQKVALVLFPLNPVLIWVERRLCAERELACDDHVLAASDAASGAGKAYAICLTRLAEFSMVRRSLSLVLGAWERRPELARRVHRLLRGRCTAMSGLQARMATVSVILLALSGGLALARSPQLVAFSAPAAVTTAHSGSSNMQANAQANLRDGLAQAATYRAERFREGEAAAQMVQAKAVMPGKPSPAVLVSKPVHRRATNRTAAPKQDPATQTWVVLTEWTDAAAPRPVLLKFDPRGTYAAVPVVGGWLIVRI
jgi:beta-lactamase regulating signal transducer with metallopeptidase domain